MLKVDSEGAIQWQRQYGGGNQYEDFAETIQQTSDGGYIVAGRTQPFDGNTDLWALKLDSNGDVTWQKRYGGVAYESAFSIQETDDGGYLILEDHTANLYSSPSELTLLKLNQQREIEWDSVVDSVNDHYMICDLLRLDDGYLAASTFVTRSPEQIGILVVKTDAHGAIAD